MKFDRFIKIMLVIIALLLVSILFVIYPKTSNAASSAPLTKSSTTQIVTYVGIGYFCIFYPEQKAIFLYEPTGKSETWELKGFFQLPASGGEILFNKTGN